MAFLEIKDLHVSIDGKQILDGLNLSIDKGEVHAIMGPNGSGKSTLANAIMGHPKYTLDSGEIRVKGELINDLSTDLRARKGLFLGFQYPTEISGVGYSHFLRNAYNQLNKSLGEEQNREVFLTVREFHEYVKRNLDAVGLDPSFLGRYLNEGFSGGEKKRSEVMQMLVLKPNIAILDEPDSGLDIDAVKAVAEAINKLIDTGAGVLVITHYARILRYMKKLDHVHVVAKGKVIKSGGKELSEELEAKGYGWLGIEEDDK
ncbi:Fe-S cluster assembly ATPase SufC [Nitrososphaera viennensis]|uniref:Fe-S cluster assembly ATPase SufC n=2 Tax=Nitrososphaera viennensis TaxID=1034015 RepID=A0A977NLV1_9ARCH|nr:Fe-S cluster assembly ATPase SufC [Nitrososphaera viennensis]AIC17239.1 putative FeS assembly ATPase SufC [Nitrososphaera viennensis EN76]UVS69123.1 Fe-S cluster assembly ATPase SufC [Nitrososphaera viennensis]